MNVANYIRKYAKTGSGKVVILKKDNINSTHKWVEYALDIVDMDALDSAQRKKDWHYRQKNFRLQDAMRIFEAAKSIAKK